MKLFFSFLSIALTLTPSYSASVPELSSPVAAAEQQESTTSTLSELIQEDKDMKATMIERNLHSMKLRFVALTEWVNDCATPKQHLAAHAEICRDPNAFPGFDIILEHMPANPDSQAAAKALLNVRGLIQLVTSGHLSPDELQSNLAELNKLKANALQRRTGEIAYNQLTFAILTADIDAQIIKLREVEFASEIEKLRKYRDAPTIDKWKLESPISTGIEVNATEELPDIATLIQNKKEFINKVIMQEVEYLESTKSRLLDDIQKINTLMEKVIAAIKRADVAKRSGLRILIESLSKDRKKINESINVQDRRLERLKQENPPTESLDIENIFQYFISMLQGA